MKKYLLTGLLFISLMSLSACSNDGNFRETAQKDGKDGIGFRRPDFGQPEEAADVRGLVKSVTGNEVVVLKIERPQINREEAGQAGAENSDIQTREGRAVLGANGGGAVRTPGMGSGMGGGFRMGGNDSGSQEQRAQMLEQIKKMASGEEKIIIPVGIRMLKPDTASEKPSMLEATLADVKADTMLQIWLDSSVTDRKVAKFVLIMN